MKFEIFCLKDLTVKGEGNLHIIILNEKTGHIFRFKKEATSRTNMVNGDCEMKPELNIYKIYKVGVNYKKYSVLQKFWGKTYLPKTRAGLMPAKIIEEIATHVESMRNEQRRHRSIIIKTDHIEIMPDLTKFPPEYECFIDGVTFCVELKPKFGILFQSRDPSLNNCLGKSSRFCLSQKRREEGNRTEFCPCDFFSGNKKRMKRAIQELIINSQDKLRIFQEGHIISTINEDTIKNLMLQLLHNLPNNNNNADLVDHFCNLIIQAVTYDKSESGELVTLPSNVSTACQAHSWSVPSNCAQEDIYNGSVLGRLIHTDCLVDNTAEEMKHAYDKLKEYLAQNNIEKKDNIFDLWNEHLITLEIPEDIREIIRKLKKYVVSLTIRDCSLMIKFCKTTQDRISKLKSKEDNSMVLAQPDGALILTTVDIIDISIKPLSKIKYNFQLEQELKTIFE